MYYQKLAGVLTALSLLLTNAPPLQAAPNATASNRFEVHEWGTFTSLQGSSGKNQAGMHHEEEALPGFVHGRDPLSETPAADPSRNRRCRSPKCVDFDITYASQTQRMNVTQKMETPVLYFYSPENKKVSVDIQFPQGIISQYYPAPTEFAPSIGQVRSLAGGRTKFDIEIVKENLTLPKVDSSSVYAPAREVPGADFIRTSQQENEKFIFYRGLGDFSTNFQATSQEGSLTIINKGKFAYPAAFLVSVDANGGNILPLGQINATASTEISQNSIQSLQSSHLNVDAFLEKAQNLLNASLETAGLFKDEARAMTNTWKHSYFRTPGLRVLYILDRTETDTILPIQITPTPASLERVLVGRVEILLDTEEQSLLRSIQQDNFKPSPQERFLEPKLRRLMEIAPDSSIRNRIQEILSSLS